MMCLAYLQESKKVKSIHEYLDQLKIVLALKIFLFLKAVT